MIDNVWLSMIDRADALRSQYAEGLRLTCGLRSDVLVRALATVPREQFLRPGPWVVIGEGSPLAQRTSDTDLRHVYRNVSVAIDLERHLFNGAPGIVARWIDALEIGPGSHVVQIGSGTGYYTAILAHCVGPTGRVIAYEIDENLTAEARDNLQAWPWADVRQGDGRNVDAASVDALIVHAGVTHPQRVWLDALRRKGRMVLPLTATFPSLGSLGKGHAVLVSSSGSADIWQAATLGMVMIYSAAILRNDVFNAELGSVLLGSGTPRFQYLRCDAHERTSACWFHQDSFCFSDNHGRASGEPPA